MNLLMNSNNLLFIGRIVFIPIIVFFILNNIAEIDKYESILLSIMVAVSIVIIETIFCINSQAIDPLNCEQCKITDVNYPIKNNYINSNLVPNPLSNETNPEYEKEGFATSNLSTLMGNLTRTITGENKQSSEEENLLQEIKELRQQRLENNSVQLKCVRMPTKENELDNLSNDELKTLLKIRMSEEKPTIENELKQKDTKIEKLEQRLTSIRNSLGGSNTKSDPFNNGSIDDFESFDNIDSDESEEEDSLDSYIDEQNKKNKKLIKTKKENNELPYDVKQKIRKMKKKIKKNENQQKTKKTKKSKKSKKTQDKYDYDSENSQDSLDSEIDNKPIIKKGTNYEEDSEIGPNYPELSDVTYDVNSVEYQQDGLQKEANVISGEQNLFKMAIGDQDVVRPYIKDGSKYYNKIFSESTNAPTAFEAQQNELKYGYYNYVGPLNKGMINKDYTFIDPTNWYPIPPHPPVCVTNKRCTTCPIQMSDGKDYMQFANLDQFNEARRFTGNMNINTEYIKNVLNNPEAQE